jgi:hypothetical protein
MKLRHWMNLVEAWVTDPLRDPNFRRWFGQSVIRDASGKPLRVYHGTSTTDFEQFDNDNGMIFFSTDPEFASGYALSTRDHAQSRLLPCYLRIERLYDFRTAEGHEIAQEFFEHEGNAIDTHSCQLIRMSLYGRSDVEDDQNPAIHDRELTEEEWMQAIEQGAFPALECWPFVHWLRERLHCDGMTIIENGVLNFAVFSPDQIKSAVSNSGTFDRRSPGLTD